MLLLCKFLIQVGDFILVLRPVSFHLINVIGFKPFQLLLQLIDLDKKTMALSPWCAYHRYLLLVLPLQKMHSTSDRLDLSFKISILLSDSQSLKSMTLSGLLEAFLSFQYLFGISLSRTNYSLLILLNQSLHLLDLGLLKTSILPFQLLFFLPHLLTFRKFSAQVTALDAQLLVL